MPERPVIVWRVDVAFLEAGDWKYETSKAGAGQGGRTHTFGISEPSKKLKGAAAYARDDIELKGGRPVLMEQLVTDSAPPSKFKTSTGKA